jgi:hypothetical protein
MASRNLAAAANQRAQTIQANINLAETGRGGPYSSGLGQYSALSDMYVNQIVENVALITAGAALGQAIGSGIMQGIVEGRMSVMDAEVTQTYRTHANSLQGDFYIRPRYQPDRGWALTLVNINTGRRAEVLLSPDNELLAQYAPNLPAFAVDPSASRIVAKGLGLDPARYDTYEKRGVFNPTGGMFSFAGFRGEMWSIPYPSIVAFDLASLPSEQKVENQKIGAKPVSANKKTLNDRLIDAAFQSDGETVKRTLDDGADVNATDEYGRTALMLAAECLGAYGKEDVVAALVQHGADVSLKDPHGWKAIDYYALVPSASRKKSGVSKSLKLLVKEGKEESEE